MLLAWFSSGAADAQDVHNQYVPAATELQPAHRWFCGVATQYRLATTANEQRLDEWLLGVNFGVRVRLLEIETQWQFSPDIAQLESARLFVGGSVRAVWPEGSSPVKATIGVGAHFEARLQRHYYAGYVTPLELGLVAWENLTRSVRFVGGPRVILGGAVIDNILLDPNGVSEDARSELDDLLNNRLEGFVGVLFARQL